MGGAPTPRGRLTVHTAVVYTITVLGGAKGFDWDLDNGGYVARPGTHPAEVEEAVEQPHLIIPARDIQGEKRWKLFGKRKIYAPEIDKTL